MSNYDAECLKDIVRRRDAGFTPSDHERDFLIRLAHEAISARTQLAEVLEEAAKLSDARCKIAFELNHAAAMAIFDALGDAIRALIGKNAP